MTAYYTYFHSEKMKRANQNDMTVHKLDKQINQLKSHGKSKTETGRESKYLFGNNDEWSKFNMYNSIRTGILKYFADNIPINNIIYLLCEKHKFQQQSNIIIYHENNEIEYRTCDEFDLYFLVF